LAEARLLLVIPAHGERRWVGGNRRTAWLASSAQVTVKSYAKRYGVDRYTAREDLEAAGFVFASGDTRWSKRPEPVPRDQPA
jgi:hypothetical protein